MASPAPAASPRVRVSLVSGEYVADRGTAEIVWMMRVGDTWAPAVEAPGATVEKAQPGPGTVWESRVDLEVSLGTRFMRVESRPRPLTQRRRPLDYLMHRSPAPARRVTRSYFTAGPRGRLERLPSG